MHWKELLPIDRYCVQMKDKLHDTDRDTLTLLYQPLIGSLAYSLYLTLWTEAEYGMGEEKQHQSLMVLTGRPLNELFSERKKLEAIGLMSTYRKKDVDEAVYIYDLKKPLTPDGFFRDGMLSVFLYNRLGKEQYRKIRNRFTLERQDLDGTENVTRSFDDVFQSLHQSEMISYQEGLNVDHLSFRGEEEKGKAYDLKGKDFDFDLMLANLPPFINKQALEKEPIKRTITQLAFVYKVEPIEMSKFIQDTMIHDDQLDSEELRKLIQRRYRMIYSQDPPSLALRKQPEHLVSQKDTPTTEEEKMIHYYETTSPMELLENRSEGAKVPPADMKIVENLMLDYHLQPGVVNVLIDYILMVNDMKLTKGFADKIAGQWSRKNIKTVKQAMGLAKQEHKNRREVAEKQNYGGKRQTAGKQVRKERLPKWLAQEKENTKEKASKKTESQVDLDREKEELAKLMQQFEKDNT
ncbi:replication initiation and membrane attachment family protein [Alteribacter aurantiacus]|uniref:replication initiation and membrane attachment family protein n=1 Tax=Alteribacter aurantiacus TaxID=254410 RepID=UPI00047E4FBB|nr:DnaD domain protein [Alteribacter aurantiacus]